MTTGEDSTRRASGDGRRPAGAETGGDGVAPRRLPTFPFRGVTETSEIPVLGHASSLSTTDTDEFATAPESGSHDGSHEAEGVATRAEAADADTSDADTEHVGPARRSAGLIVTVAVMTVLLIAASALIAYLWRVSEAWEAQVQEITDVSYGLGEVVAAEREALAEAEQRIDLLEAQLTESKDTVSRLQAENAQWGDDAAFAQEQISVLQTTIAGATAVANSLSRCIEGHEQLVTYLENPDDYDPAELASFQTSVTDLCTAAKDANLALQQAVAP